MILFVDVRFRSLSNGLRLVHTDRVKRNSLVHFLRIRKTQPDRNFTIYCVNACVLCRSDQAVRCGALTGNGLVPFIEIGVDIHIETA